MKRNVNPLAAFLAALTLVVLMPLAQAQTYTDLFDFDDNAHGCCAQYPSQLAQGRDGNLYGVEDSGGAHGEGTIFKITPAGVITDIHDFDGTNGSLPMGGLTLGTDGNLYGTTFEGGPAFAGMIFKITPAGVYTVLYTFKKTTDGGNPKAPPVQGTDGNFYGTTSSSGGATFYKITPAGVFTTLGSAPGECDGGLILGNDGKFYGTTLRGGTFGEGTFFSLTTAGVLTTLHNFTDPTGDFPTGPLLLANDGNFYGTGSDGGGLSGGVIFKLSPSGTYTELHDFDSSGTSVAKVPTAGLVQGSDGFLYGTTSQGGSAGDGTIFKIKTNGTGFAILHTFTGPDGSDPSPTPILHTNGKIYGQTNSGGSKGQGVFYSFDAGLKSFVAPVVVRSGKVGASVQLLGQGFNTATKVLFGTGAGTFTATSATFMTAKIVSGATTGVITVDEPSGNLTSPQKFKIVPAITSFTPTSGPVGTSVTINGTSFTGATAVKFGGVATTTFTVNSDSKITATVPSGAVTGKISVTTPGGTGSSSTNFTVN